MGKSSKITSCRKYTQLLYDLSILKILWHLAKRAFYVEYFIKLYSSVHQGPKLLKHYKNCLKMCIFSLGKKGASFGLESISEHLDPLSSRTPGFARCKSVISEVQRFFQLPGSCLVKSRHFGLPLAQTIRPILAISLSGWLGRYTNLEYLQSLYLRRRGQ